MRNILLICMMLLALSVKALAQENNIVVKGVVTDTNKEPMIGVNVSIAEMPGLGAITDINGRFSVKMQLIINSYFHISDMIKWKCW